MREITASKHHAWQDLLKNSTYRRKFVRFVSAPSVGAKSGKIAGRKSDIAVRLAEKYPNTIQYPAAVKEDHPDYKADYNEYDNFAFHPHNILLILVLLGISALFLAFSASFVYTRVQNNLPPIRLPYIFIFNTLILLGSSAAMVWAKRAYRADQTLHYQRALWAVVVLSLLFMFLQFLGWRSLFLNQVYIHTDNSAGYLYVISILHFAHLLAGLPFLGMFIWTAQKRMREPVSVLIYFSDPEKKLKLRLLSIYWHFLDALWIYLVIFFYLNYLIR